MPEARRAGLRAASQARRDGAETDGHAFIRDVSRNAAIRETTAMEKKPQRFNWDDEPEERTTTFQSSMQSINSSLEDSGAASRWQARRAAAKRSLYKLIALAVALLGASGLLFYEISKRF